MLGPVLITQYTTPLSAINSSFNINHHLFADDTQISLSVSNAKESLEHLQHSLMAMSDWMTRSKLNLNPSKNFFSFGPNFSEKNS